MQLFDAHCHLDDEHFNEDREEVIKNNIDILITVGGQGKIIAQEAQKGCKNVKSFSTNSEAIEYLDSIIQPQDTILVKASNGMKFKEIVEHFQ